MVKLFVCQIIYIFRVYITIWNNHESRWVFRSSKHNYVTYAVHNYVCLQFSSFGMEIYQQLYTPPMTALVFSTFWAGIGYNFCLKFYQTLLKIRGGELMCVHPVSRTWGTSIGMSSAGPILILLGGEWWLLFVTCHAYLSLPYILGRFWVQFLSQIHGPKISYTSIWNSGLLFGLVKLCS